MVISPQVTRCEIETLLLQRVPPLATKAVRVFDNAELIELIKSVDCENVLFFIELPHDSTKVLKKQLVAALEGLRGYFMIVCQPNPFDNVCFYPSWHFETFRSGWAMEWQLITNYKTNTK